MLFRKKNARPQHDGQSPNNGSREANSATCSGENTGERSPPTVSSAETAHLVGPGCVRLQGRVPLWQPVSGRKLRLHPQYLKRILCYGNVDFSTAALRLFWKRRIHVVFLSPGGHAVLGKLEPGGSSPNLRRLQHLAAADPAFSLTLARQTVSDKIAAAAATCRYFQQQGKGQDGGRVLAKLKECGTQAEQAKSVATLLGLEGSAAALWYGFLASVLPAGWTLPGRVAHPPTDPVNALLSLGYTFALTRCQTLLAAADLDPLVGFLHEVRPGRPSLACDLVEPLRAPLVDRLVVGMLARRQLTLDSFAQQDKAWRLNPESFKLVLSNFEQAFSQTGSGASWKEQTLVRIDQWSSSIRRHFER